MRTQPGFSIRASYGVDSPSTRITSSVLTYLAKTVEPKLPGIIKLYSFLLFSLFFPYV